MLIKKFRYDFSSEIKSLLDNFYNINAEKGRKDFKESWTLWINSEEIKSHIDSECARLLNEGYKGDVLDKMYKSVRYYNKKKEICPREKVNNQHTNRFSTQFLDIIDKNVGKHLEEEIESTSTISLMQNQSYKRFCLENKEELLRELIRLRQEKGVIPEDIEKKLKKTYKNRFYNVRKSYENN